MRNTGAVLNETIQKLRDSLAQLQKETDALYTREAGQVYERDPALVAAELKTLRSGNALLHSELTTRTRERDLARESADRLRQTRTEVRTVLGANFGERTADAAKRAVEARANFSEARIRTILGAKLSETTEQAAVRVMKPGSKMALAVTNLRKARNEVREILGARPGEGSRAAARRVVSQLEKQPIYPKTSCDRSTVFHVYNELDEMAQSAGYPPGSVGAFVRRLAVGKKTYAE